MSSDFQRQIQRREFFRAAARYGSLAAMGVAVYLTTRRRPGQSCINNSICRGCAAFRDCGLPAALSAKVAKVAQVSKPAVSQTSKSADRSKHGELRSGRTPAGLETRDTADLEVCATSKGANS